MIDIREVPKELLDKIKKQFDDDLRVVRMRIKQRNLFEQNKLKEALSLARDIENLYNETVLNYLKEAEESAEKIDIDNLNIPIEQKDKMLSLMMVLFMACDCIESSIIDINDILHVYDKELNFEMFDDIRNVSIMAKEKLKFLQDNSDYMKDLVWAEKCDNMYDMMKSKALSIINKRKNSINWGENLKKYV